MGLTPLVDRLSSLCDCMAGPAGAVSNYLAFGTSMDWMYVRLGVRYPLTVEVYGGRGEGKLRGETWGAEECRLCWELMTHNDSEAN